MCNDICNVAVTNDMQASALIQGATATKTHTGGLWLDWDDYRFVDALARSGSVRGAARELNVNASTVTRRLDGLESRLGVALFTRSQRGMLLTQEGQEAVERLAVVRDELQQIERGIKGRDMRLEGRLRVAVPDVLAVHFLMRDLAQFTTQYPGIDLVLLPGYLNLNVAAGEADIAIRATEMPAESLVGRPLSRIALAVYGSRDYLRDRFAADQAEGVPWIDWAARGEVMSLYARLRERHFPQAKVHLRCNQIFMQHVAIREHMGLGVLPCIVGDADASLQRVPGVPSHPGPMLWLLTHPDLRSARRVQAFMTFVRDVFERRAEELADPADAES